jgi:hypothetical protein
MGIKFHCPNGHKLNVKSFLAGKRGVCPKCGTSMRIPMQSEPGLADAREDAGEGEDLAGEVPVGEVRAPAAPAAQPAVPVVPVAAVPVAAPRAVPAIPTVPVVAAGYVPTSPAVQTAVPVAAPASGLAGPDPLLESPHAVWYVRPPPPTGGQYGPARAEVMRRWMGEGRVSSDSLVWREGWPEWRTAGEVFPSLQAAGPQPPPPPADQPATPMRSQRLSNRYTARKKQGSGLAIAALVVLALVCIILAVLLVYFLGGFHNGESSAVRREVRPMAASRASADASQAAVEENPQ